jgi:hypothetical protein
MLWTVALVLLLLWVLGVMNASTMGGFLHLLLVAAIVLVVVRVLQGRKPADTDAPDDVIV